MRGVTLFSILCFCCLLQTTCSEEQTIFEKLVILIILYLETLLEHYFADPLQLLPQSTLYFNSTSLSSLMEGEVSVGGIYLYGLKGLHSTREDITFVLDQDKSKITFGLKLNLSDEVGIKIGDYQADIGIVKQIPVYGTGDFLLGLKGMNIAINAEIDFADQLKLTNFQVRPVPNFANITLTGFWKNPDVSKILSTVLNGLADVVIIFWDLEIDCVSCGVSSLILSILSKSEDAWADMQTRCKDICGPSSYPLVSTAFNRPNMSEYVRNISEDDMINYIEIARDYFVTSIESHL